MSNRRRPERRDHHGAPMRSRQEITIAVATGVAVLGGTVGLLFLIDRLQREDSPGVVTPPVTQPAGPSSSTKPAGSSSSTSASSASSTTRASSTSSGSASSTTSSRPPSSSTTRP